MTETVPTGSHATDDGWVRTWGAAPHAPLEALGPVPSFSDTTVRHVVRISGGGRQVRVRFTNEYGTAPLTIGAARVGVVAPDGVRPGGDRVLTFAGSPTATVPAGAPILSDPVDLPLPALSELSIGLYLPERVETCTCHAMGVQTCWVIPGNAVADPTDPDMATSLPLLAFVSAVEVLPDGPARTVVVIGDSLTDGVGSTPGTDRRWTDRLAERLAERGAPAISLSNQGIGGNRLLNDGFGDSALARFDRDVLATPGLSHVVVSEGMNDIAVSFAPRDDGALAGFVALFPGAPVTTDDVIAGYRRLIARAHGHGVTIYAATLTPWEGADMFSADGEKARQEVNGWIRTGGAFDGVLDFDAVWRDPARPARIRDGFHADDHLHGTDAGYLALADSVDLSLFR
ncbi:SGNH/GDSL hydrolase family protein [Streptomyces sp. NPDC102451]|uniref:SGNH/GDSL hydrolase family protein n=1 Tax=Streptomyces sp. NPDC102451 TaxID=3366177 RepID=UPI003828E36E